jgi:glycogen debranching enzyme
MRRLLFACVFLCVGLSAHVARTAATQQATSMEDHDGVANKLAWSTDAVAQRFIAVHGRRALAMGYPQLGLEIWAYPLQLVSDYQVSFIPRPGAYALDGQSLLRRVEYRPEEVVRTYVGPDFVVRERIFVPLDEPGAILSYEVQGRRGIDLEVKFQPVLNLMWPGALGGQDTGWDEGVHGYVIREPLHGSSAVIASPQTIEHDAIMNRTIQPTTRRTLIIRPKVDSQGRMIAQVFTGYDPQGVAPASGVVARLRAHVEQSYVEQVAHYSELLGNALQIETPDEDVNRTLAWSVVALDQAWVCNPLLGCGEVAGYGPSRGERRPQYAWFFAGDGLVATEALVAAGEFQRAREELAFIAKYQDKSTGMIWHEISQAVDIGDWKREYPYMFVHVDITFSYLGGFADYVKASGDEAFLKEQWPGIQAAYRYCESILDPSTGLPQIPPGREGANEQDRMRDDIGLSSSWVSAAEGYAEMAQRMGETQEVRKASQAAGVARKAIAALDWDATHHYWLQGHSASGEPIYSQRPRPTALLLQHIFTEEQDGEVMDALASPDFQTDWGVRSMSATSTEFDPNSYSKGSVSALGTSSVALAFWNQHRSVTALQIWDGLLPWNTLDSEGHIHEVAAGDFYHPEIESVPEQTWSSAGFYSATVHGLLGLEVDAAKRHITLAPHLPPEWDYVNVDKVRVGESVLKLRLRRSQDRIELAVENSGPAVSIEFRPEVPMGAAEVNASVEAGQTKASRLPASVERDAQDEHVATAFTAEEGSTRCRIRSRGGVQVSVPRTEPRIGDPSRELKIVDVSLRGKILSITAYLRQAGEALFSVRSGWKLTGATGAALESHERNLYRMVLQTPPGGMLSSDGSYAKVSAELRFAKR